MVLVRAQNIDSLKQVLVQAEDEQKQHILDEIADYYIRTIGESDFITYRKTIGSKFIESTDLGEVFHHLGKIFIKKKKNDKAYEYLQYANNIFLQNKDNTRQEKVKVDLALVHAKFYDYELSTKLLKQAIRYFKETEIEKEEAQAITCLGDVFYQFDQFDNALKMYNQSLNMLIGLSDSLKIADIYFKIGKTYSSITDFENSLAFFDKSLSIYESLNYKKGIADYFYETALIYAQKDEFSKADNNFGKSIKIYEKLQDLQGLSQSYLALGNYYLSIGEKDKVFYYLSESLYAAEFINSKESLLEIYKSLSNYYEKEKIYDQAIFYYKNYSNLKDSLSSKTQLYKLAQVKSQIENEAKDEIIKELEADSFFKDQALRKQQNFLMASIMSGILAIIMVMILFSNTRRRKKSNLELTEKNISLKKAEEELIKANRELFKSEKRLKEIVQNMPVLISASNAEGEFIFWNSTCEIVLGFTKEEVIKNSHFSDQLMLKAKKLGELSLKRADTILQATEFEMITKSGDIKDIVWTNMSKVFPVEGWADWHVGIDVTERNLFAKSLERETAILNSILNSIPHPIFYKDKEGVYQRANPGFYNMHGLAEESLLGKTDNDVFSKEEAQYFMDTDNHIFKSAAPFKELRWWVMPDGESLLFDTIKSPLYNSKNEIIGIVGISFDLTVRHHIEHELKKQKEKAEEADRLKSAFLANMSHEIRSPMNAIIGFSNLVSDSFELDTEISTYMDYIKQSGANLLQLVDDIIDIAKLEAGQLKIRNDKFDLDDMLEKLMVTVQTSPHKASKSQIEIRLNIPHDSDKPIIISDELRIKQVLNNFISNALKFTDEGFIEFGYEKMPGNEILFYTKDTGIGISNSYKEVIFDRFGQVKETYTRNTSGTGLGLAISKSIVELFKGEIWFDSKPGIGSTFYFKIPVEYSLQKPEKEIEPLYKIKDYDWTGKQVLIGEDDDMNFKVLKSLLNKTNINISRAVNGKEALSMATSEIDYDLILMDIQLPLLNGYDASKKIKKKKNVPIIAVTAYAMPGEKEKSIKAGCDHFIVKPINRYELLHKMFVSFSKK
jgi:PAS domain S-box-containing protein